MSSDSATNELLRRIADSLDTIIAAQPSHIRIHGTVGATPEVLAEMAKSALRRGAR